MLRAGDGIHGEKRLEVGGRKKRDVVIVQEGFEGLPKASVILTAVGKSFGKSSEVGRSLWNVGHQLPFRLELRYIDHASTALRTRIETTQKWIRAPRKEKGAIAGGAVGGPVFVAVLGISAWRLLFRKMGKHAHSRFVIDDENLRSQTGPRLPFTERHRRVPATGGTARRDTQTGHPHRATQQIPRISLSYAGTHTNGPQVTLVRTTPLTPAETMCAPIEGGGNQPAGSTCDQNLEDCVRILEALTHINSKTAPQGPPSYEAAGGPAS
ncbi:hypothetical protein GGX14DRAFT_406907 [Mycena pura]|uniref:Uncharacterized protein n=1 Tax=Mycena pura TaxID=153505 RepID=A0AAD6XXR9_9AGAR|nr:hypothetical protein GGX14DRAFT_406907 [Mycena pura]